MLANSFQYFETMCYQFVKKVHFLAQKHASRRFSNEFFDSDYFLTNQDMMPMLLQPHRGIRLTNWLETSLFDFLVQTVYSHSTAYELHCAAVSIDLRHY